MSDYTPIQVRGIAVYPKVYKIDELAQKFVVPLVVTDAVAAELESRGMKPAGRKDGTLKSFSSLGFEGKVFEFKSLHKPRVVDSASKDITTIIGNGSEVMIHGATRPYTMGTGGVAGYLNTLQVISLIEFEGGEGKIHDVPAIEGGFISSETEASSSSNTNEYI
jgi:hypothetical protein